MEIKLLDFVQECKRLAKQALGRRAGESASGGFAHWKHLVLHCIRIEDGIGERPDDLPDDVPSKATITIKEINDNRYYYWQWREGEKIRSQYEGPVNPDE
jgi:hypothetical protein